MTSGGGGGRSCSYKDAASATTTSTPTTSAAAGVNHQLKPIKISRLDGLTSAVFPLTSSLTLHVVEQQQMAPASLFGGGAVLHQQQPTPGCYSSLRNLNSNSNNGVPTYLASSFELVLEKRNVINKSNNSAPPFQPPRCATTTTNVTIASDLTVQRTSLTLTEEDWFWLKLVVQDVDTVVNHAKHRQALANRLL